MKVLFISLLFFIGGLTPEEPACDSLKFTTSITHTSKGLTNGQISVAVKRGKAPFKASLFSENKKNNLENVELDELTNLTSGKYILVVQDAAGCTVQKKLTLK